MISIHILRVEDDMDDGTIEKIRKGFQSTSSVWRMTAACDAGIDMNLIFQSTSSVWRMTVASEFVR